MAVDKLALYNNALVLLGQRRLLNLSEDRPVRYHLDNIYDLDAVAYCLEIVKPVFSRKTAHLIVSVASGEHGLDNVFSLPADYIDVIGVYSDEKLDEPVSRHIIEGRTLACEYPTVYLRYVSNDHVTNFASWSPSFPRVVGAYLAREICTKVNPGSYEEIDNLFNSRVKISLELEADKEPRVRSRKPTVTLTAPWLAIYNDALGILGLDEIVSDLDDSDRRSKLDRVVNAGVVQEMLEDIGWLFATVSTKSQYDPSVEPAWGYRRAHGKPADMYRIDGIFVDEYLKVPLKDYRDEGDYFFSDYDTFYLSYVTSSFLSTPDLWPFWFRRLIASKIAFDASAYPSINKTRVDMQRVNDIYQERRRSALGNDAVSRPPRVISNGSWTAARTRGSPYNGRP